MVSTLILTHGGLARELVEAAEMILGRQPQFEALSLSWTDTFEESAAKTRARPGESRHRGWSLDSDRYVRRDPLQCGGQLPQNG